MSYSLLLGIGTVFLMVLVYFAGVSRGKHNRREEQINQVVDRYLSELRNNPNCPAHRYPFILLDAGILRLAREKDMKKVIELIERSHNESPFCAYEGHFYIDNLKQDLLVFQENRAC